MRNKSRTHDKVLSDAFSSFKKATRKAFAFLCAPAYKFNEVQTFFHPPECIVRYENKTTGVCLKRSITRISLSASLPFNKGIFISSIIKQGTGSISDKLFR